MLDVLKPLERLNVISRVRTATQPEVQASHRTSDSRKQQRWSMHALTRTVAEQWLRNEEGTGRAQRLGFMTYMLQGPGAALVALEPGSQTDAPARANALLARSCRTSSSWPPSMCWIRGSLIRSCRKQPLRCGWWLLRSKTGASCNRQSSCTGKLWQ